jgi:hypothetical protein
MSPFVLGSATSSSVRCMNHLHLTRPSQHSTLEWRGGQRTASETCDRVVHLNPYACAVSQSVRAERGCVRSAIGQRCFWDDGCICGGHSPYATHDASESHAASRLASDEVTGPPVRSSHSIEFVQAYAASAPRREAHTATNTNARGVGRSRGGRTMYTGYVFTLSPAHPVSE